jgi:hypothetical protein
MEYQSRMGFQREELGTADERALDAIPSSKGTLSK